MKFSRYFHYPIQSYSINNWTTMRNHLIFVAQIRIIIGEPPTKTTRMVPAHLSTAPCQTPSRPSLAHALRGCGTPGTCTWTMVTIGIPALFILWYGSTMINPLFIVNVSMIWHVVDIWIMSSLKNGEWQYKPIVHQMLGDKPCYFSQVTTGNFLMATFRMKP